jgi:hypothetical protein
MDTYTKRHSQRLLKKYEADYIRSKLGDSISTHLTVDGDFYGISEITCEVSKQGMTKNDFLIPADRAYSKDTESDSFNWNI